MTTFNLEELNAILKAFNHEDCAVFTNNCIVALENNCHKSGCSLLVEGDQQAQFRLQWAKEFKKGRYKENTEITKNAAEAISFFLSKELTPYTVVEQATIGTGIDYWMAYSEGDPRYDPRNFLQARIEISGIATETPNNTVEKRSAEKKAQTAKSDHSGLPVYTSVVEFSTPWAKFEKK